MKKYVRFNGWHQVACSSPSTFTQRGVSVHTILNNQLEYSTSINSYNELDSVYNQIEVVVVEKRSHKQSMGMMLLCVP